MDIENAQVQERMAALFDWIGRVGQDIESGVRAEAPELAKEMLSWGINKEIFLGAMGVVAGAIFFAAYKRAMSSFKRAEKQNAARKTWHLQYDKVSGSGLAYTEVLAAREALGPEPESSDAVGWSVIATVSLFLSVITPVVFVSGGIYDIIKIKTAPRLYLIDTAKEWVGKK